MHVHLIGVCGTGMGALAGLLREAGHRVTGSDRAFHPPMGPALERWGVVTMQGWNPANLDPAPDLVIVGNVCRSDNPEAIAAIDGGLRFMSFPAAMEEMFLERRPSLVVAGTHGKTTTTSLLAHLLREAKLDPGFLVGGIPRNFDTAFRLGRPTAPFVIEGDEYDSAFFEKTPKFWRYRPSVVLLTSIEHDHIDIYPTEREYMDAFVGLVRRIPDDGLLVAFAGDPRVREVASDARCRVVTYGLDSDGSDAAWLGALGRPVAGAQPIHVFGGGTLLGRVMSPLSGAHNARNAIGAIAAAAEGAEADLGALFEALPSFAGVRRRQELLGVAGGVFVYEDFAHHPTAVRETLRGLRQRHERGRLIAVFEPRSATASRRLHQAEYPVAFADADVTILAPVGRPEIPEAERLDTAAIAAAIEPHRRAVAASTHDEIVARVTAEARDGDVVVLMSNGDFGGIYDRVLLELTISGAP